MESFDLIPIACIVNGKFLAVHGGISPELISVFSFFNFNENKKTQKLDEIKKMDRYKEPPKVGLFWFFYFTDFLFFILLKTKKRYFMVGPCG